MTRPAIPDNTDVPVDIIMAALQRTAQSALAGEGTGLLFRQIELPDGSVARVQVIRGEILMVVVCVPENPLPSPTAVRARFGLTPRQTEVALLMAHGGSDKSISRRIGVKTCTVRRHAEQVRTKLNISSRRELRGKLLNPG
jgi:DNA-binding NarL/FixJ family response regulator